MTVGEVRQSWGPDHDNANELVQREREVAKLIWGVIEGLGGDRPRNWGDE